MNRLQLSSDCALRSAVRDGTLTALMSPGPCCARTSSLTWQNPKSTLRQSPAAPGYCRWRKSRDEVAKLLLKAQNQFGEAMFDTITLCSILNSLMRKANGSKRGVRSAASSNPTVAGRAGCLAKRGLGVLPSQGGGLGAAQTGGHERSQTPSVPGGPTEQSASTTNRYNNLSFH